jgi:hypothetical protein
MPMGAEEKEEDEHVLAVLDDVVDTVETTNAFNRSLFMCTIRMFFSQSTMW